MTHRHLLAWLPLLTIACGSSSSAEGALGHLSYRLSSDFEAESGDLREVQIVVGHKQWITVELTEDGEKAVKEEGDVFHRMKPSHVATFEGGGSDDSLSDVVVTVSEGGTHTLESVEGDEIIDYIALDWAVPKKIDTVLWLKNPSDDDFETVDGGTVAATEGAQLAMLPVPVRNGERLAGAYEVEVSADPPWAVAITEEVLGIYEQRVVTASNERSLVFIEPGTVTVTMTDPVHGISTSQVYEVAPIATD